MKSNNKSNKNSKIANRGQSANPPSNVVSYRGPAILPGSYEQYDVHSVNMSYEFAVTSTAAGTIDFATGSGGVSNVGDWASISAGFAEYRVLAMRFRYFPYNRYSKTTTTCIPFITAVDRNSSSSLGSYANAANHASAKISSIEDPWQRDVKMDGADEAAFQPVSSATSFFWLKVYASGLSISTTYGLAVITYLVQFRGKE